MSRYVRRDSRIYMDSACVLCGTHWGGWPNRMCARTTCLACGTAQCVGNGNSNGLCPLCVVGLLPGFWGNDRRCERLGCRERAVMFVDNRYRCLGHGGPRRASVVLGRVFRGTVAEALERVRRQRGESWMEVADDGCVLAAAA